MGSSTRNNTTSEDFNTTSHTHHDRTAKRGLKNKERFESFIKFGVSAEKFNALDFTRLEFIDTEFFQQEVKGGKSYTRRADIMAKIGLKGMSTQTLVGIITEHKSHAGSEKELYLQAARYNIGLLESNIYPVMTVLLLHGHAPLRISSDLQQAFQWTSEMKRIFGHSALNFAPDVVDLRKKSEEEISQAGACSALCYTLKDIWSMTQDKIQSMFRLCRRSSIDGSNYREYANILVDYVLQGTSYSLEDLNDLEAKVILNKEDRVMPSTYERIIEEGLQKGRQEGLQEAEQSIILKLLKHNVDISTIEKSTGTSKSKILQMKKKLKI